jgi:hypothetical protein
VKKTLWMKAKKIPDYVLFVYVVLNMIIWHDLPWKRHRGWKSKVGLFFQNTL